MNNVIVRFLREEEGTELVEWGLIAGIIIAFSVAVFAAIATDVNTLFVGVQGQTTQAAAKVP